MAQAQESAMRFAQDSKAIALSLKNKSSRRNFLNSMASDFLFMLGLTMSKVRITPVRLH
jgi:hypothetical protein